MKQSTNEEEYLEQALANYKYRQERLQELLVYYAGLIAGCKARGAETEYRLALSKGVNEITNLFGGMLY